MYFGKKPTIDQLIEHPIRSAIIASILSRENASRFGEIAKDLDVHKGLVYGHLKRLEDTQIIEKAPDYAGTRGHVYYISGAREELQSVLRSKFPQYFVD